MGHEKRMGEPLKTGPEYDALTGWRYCFRWRPGQRKAAKNAYNRRVRRRGLSPEEVFDGDGGERGSDGASDKGRGGSQEL